MILEKDNAKKTYTIPVTWKVYDLAESMNQEPDFEIDERDGI